MFRFLLFMAKRNGAFHKAILGYYERFIHGPFNREISLKIDALHKEGTDERT